MATVTADEATEHLRQLLDRVEAGEEIVIARDGKPVARLVPEAPKSREHLLSWAKGTIQFREDAFDPWPDEFLDLFEPKIED